VPHYGLPEDMSGMRVLEIGTWDGFWAFEMERRGAEVVALDLDDERGARLAAAPTPQRVPEYKRGRGFALAHELLGSSVERVVCNIYRRHAGAPRDCSTSSSAGRCSSTCATSSSPWSASPASVADVHQRERGVRPAPQLIPMRVSHYLADRDAAVVFWLPNVRTWKAMFWSAGFDRVVEHKRFKWKSNHGYTARTWSCTATRARQRQKRRAAAFALGRDDPARHLQSRLPADVRGSLPTFLIIGAAKAGTTSLHSYLAEHPEISMSSEKEPMCFEPPDWHRRLGEYASCSTSRGRSAGEASIAYSPTRGLRRSRIGCARWSRTPRIVYLVRDPIERMLSHCAHMEWNRHLWGAQRSRLRPAHGGPGTIR